MDIVTYERRQNDIDPVVPVLQMLVDTGSWPDFNVTIHTVSTRVSLCPVVEYVQHVTEAVARGVGGEVLSFFGVRRPIV